MGCRLFILDEDTCASNFMIRDSRMRSMIAHEPITPFIYRVNSLWNQLGISTVVVIGGSGDWFDVHDTVILLDNYLCKDMTKKAYSISKQFCTGRVTFNGRGLVHQLPWPCPAHCRVLTKKSCDQMMKRLISSNIQVNEDGSKVWYTCNEQDQITSVVDLARIEQRIQHKALTQGIIQVIFWVLRQAQYGGEDELGMIERVEHFYSIITQQGKTFCDVNKENMICSSNQAGPDHSFCDTLFMMPRCQDVMSFINRMGREFNFTYKYYGN